jgi:hypothetical protein
MKFIVVNHRTPRGNITCIECSRSLGPGYVRDVATRRGYCDYDCYRRYHLRDIAFSYFTTPAHSRPDRKDLVSLGLAAGDACCPLQLSATKVSTPAERSK